jgi:NADPH:quinone reductase-like Zn-dependent oxidoreductase
MHAVLLKGHGGLDQLEYRTDLPVPAPGRGEVLVRVAAAAVNNTDVNTRIGWYSKSVATATDMGGAAENSAAPCAERAADGGWAGDALTFPRIQGADACGSIVAVGADVDPARIGERVLVDPILRDAASPPRYFGSDTPGAFAEFVAIPAVNACRVRSPLTDAELASFPCSYLAAENMLTRAEVVSGERVLVTGASGGVGSAAVQLARRRGATVVAQAGRAKSAALESLGASRVVPRDDDVVAALGRESIDVVVDVVGGAGFPALLRVLRRRGRYACAGAIAGPVVDLDLRDLYLKDLRLLGCTVPDDGVFQALVGHIERGEVQPLVSAVFPLAEIAAAQTRFLEKGHLGKIVLVH